MPKLHDACQILVEDLLAALGAFGPAERGTAFDLGLAAACRRLAASHPQSGPIIEHLALVADELSAKRPDWPTVGAPPVPALEDNDPRLLRLTEQAVSLADALFPPKLYHE